MAAAIGGVQGDAHLIGKDGKAIVYGGAPNIGFSVDPTQPQFNSLTLAEGAWPKAGEVIVDKSTAGKEHFTVGQTIGIQSRGPVEKFRISGIAKYGAVSSIGGATLAGFDLPAAQSLFDKDGKLDQIRIAKKSGVSQAELIASVRTILPDGTQVRSGDARRRRTPRTSTASSRSCRSSSSASAGRALRRRLRDRELALDHDRAADAGVCDAADARRLSAPGAVLGAHGVPRVGSLASVVGLFLGLALAKGLFWLFTTFGATLPNNGLPVRPRTIVVSLLVGILVTVLASLRPAFRATRVPPIAAVREGAFPRALRPLPRSSERSCVAALGFALV